MRQLVRRITLRDCDRQTFRAGGPGGQNQNVRETGVRIVHRESGAVGESREQRHQHQNEKTAWRRMGESLTFRAWARSLCDLEIPPSRSSERVRTYNLVDNRVKDHRTGRSSTRVREVLGGDLDLIR